MLNLVEQKNIYTIYLVNILTPLIFEGIHSIYIEACKISNTDNVLKIFQSFLKRIPKWNREMIDKEANRIINSTQSYEWLHLNDLIKATIKANLAIMLYDHSVNIQSKIDPVLYQNINIMDFIHKIYCECARDIWNSPDLFYHNYPPLEIKRNQRECLNIIKECIREAIRKLIPMRHILKIYLGENVEYNKANDAFEKVLTEEDKQYLPKMINTDLGDKKHDEKPLELSYNGSELQNALNKSKQETDPEQTIGTKILKILDQPDKRKIESDGNIFKSLVNQDKAQTNNKYSKEHSLTIDEKIKKVLYNDNRNKTLPEDSDAITSLNYSFDEANKYQEIFSNFNMAHDKQNDSPISHDNKQFFNKYKQF
jgi:hypothetical protein